MKPWVVHLKSHQEHCSTPTLSRAPALPKLVSLRSFGFYRSELDRTELPRVLGTPCSLDLALPKAVPLTLVVVANGVFH